MSFLSTLLKQWTSSYAFFLKSRYLTGQVYDAIFLNREWLLWNHVKNLFQLKNNSLLHKGNYKTRLKTENNFTIYPTVLHSKCAIHSRLIMSQFLSTLEVRKMVVGCALLPTNSILHICQKELTIHHHSSLFQQLKYWKKSLLTKNFPLFEQVSKTSFEVMK